MSPIEHQTAPDAFSQEAASIAIVVPNYNHSRYLPESLGSIVAQTRRPDEVLVIDDASSDDSLSVIASYLEERPRWRMISHPVRAGVVRRQNEAIAEIGAEWITFLGADDILSPDYVERVHRLALEYPRAGLICGCVEVFGRSRGRTLRPPILPRLTPGYVRPDEYRELLAVGDNYFVGTACLYRKRAIADIGGFDEELGSASDGFLARRLAARYGVCFVPAILGGWRIHGKNYSVASVTDVSDLEQKIVSLKRALDREPPGVFRQDYARLLERRLRFGSARLIALDSATAARVRAKRIAELTKPSSLEQRMLRLLMLGGRVGPLVALAWLAMRLHPFSFVRFLSHLRVRRALLAGRARLT